MEGDEWRKVRMTPELMEELIHAAAGRDYRIEWGEPDEEGFYTPTVYDDRADTPRKQIVPVSR